MSGTADGDAQGGAAGLAVFHTSMLIGVARSGCGSHLTARSDKKQIPQRR
jgi:hypothetical protein